MNHSKETVLKTVSELFDLVKEKQSKVDALTLQVAEMKSRLNDAYTDGQSAMYTARQSKIDELQSGANGIALALSHFVMHPI